MATGKNSVSKPVVQNCFAGLRSSAHFATGQLAVRLDIIEREGDSAKRLQVFSPVGMYLQNPVKLTIDQGKPYRVPYSWCLTNACIAGTVANLC